MREKKMTIIDASGMEFKEINEKIRRSGDDCTITGCCGQRFIGAGMSGKNIVIDGVPGNALGAYLNGASITVNANVQDAVGDTMNEGEIVVYGNIGDTAGYAMRGGQIFVKGNAGYRTGIHMKAYQEKVPVLVIGGVAGSFLGEYQAGGKIIVLGLNAGQRKIVGYFPCTGMHGGKIYLRSDCKDVVFPDQVDARRANAEDLEEIREYIEKYCRLFGESKETVLNAPFTVVTPDTNNPYHQMYIPN